MFYLKGEYYALFSFDPFSLFLWFFSFITITNDVLFYILKYFYVIFGCPTRHL